MIAKLKELEKRILELLKRLEAGSDLDLLPACYELLEEYSALSLELHIQLEVDKYDDTYDTLSNRFFSLLLLDIVKINPKAELICKELQQIHENKNI